MLTWKDWETDPLNAPLPPEHLMQSTLNKISDSVTKERGNKHSFWLYISRLPFLVAFLPARRLIKRSPSAAICDECRTWSHEHFSEVFALAAIVSEYMKD